MKYRREIDGLRAIAVLPVIFFHGGNTLFSGGYIGVDVFFVFVLEAQCGSALGPWGSVWMLWGPKRPSFDLKRSSKLHLLHKCAFRETVEELMCPDDVSSQDGPRNFPR